MKETCDWCGGTGQLCAGGVCDRCGGEGTILRCALCGETLRADDELMEGYDPMEPLSGSVVCHVECGLAQGLEVA